MGIIISDLLIEKIIEFGINKTKNFFSSKSVRTKLEVALNDIRKDFVSKYGSETYWNELDKYLEESEFVDNIIMYLCSTFQEKSIKHYCDEIYNGFYNEKFISHKASICKCIDEYGQALQQEIANIISNDFNTELLIGVKNVVTENHDILIDVNRKLDEYKFNQERSSDCTRNYYELKAILLNDELSYYDKELRYIEWSSKNEDILEAYVFMASNCVKMGDYDRALYYFKYVVKMDEDEYGLYNNIGLIYKDRKEYDEASKCFNMVLAKDTDNIYAHYNLAIVHFLRREIGKCVEILEELHGKHPEDYETSCFLASVLLQTNVDNAKRAEELLRSALTICPNDYNSTINLGYALLFQGKCHEAVKLLENYANDNSFDYFGYALLGTICASEYAYDKDKAILYFEKAYECSGNKGYLTNIMNLKNNCIFDSVVFNGNIVKI